MIPMAALPFVAGFLNTLSSGMRGFKGLGQRIKAAQQPSENVRKQEEFARHGIRWRVEDARAAGIHPLYAMNAQIPSFSPTYVEGGSSADTASQMGQDLSRAIDATRTADEKVEARLQSLQLDNFSLQNDLLRSQIARLNQGTGPAMPGAIDPIYDPQASRTVVVDPIAPGRDPGSVNDMAFSREGDKWFVTKSKDITERTEDDIIQQVTWALRNQLLPLFAPQSYPGTALTPPPPSDPLKPGHRWKWTGLYYTQTPVGR